jgi:sporulation protein YlmC with PRC-barrel domain
MERISMAINQFENSRISEGTLRGGAQHDQSVPNESRTISRDDVRDGFANLPATTRTKASHLLAAGALIGDRVRNPAGEKLGEIEEIVLNPEDGRIVYAVLSFGGVLGIGDKLFAVPWSALQIDGPRHQFILDVDRRNLEKAPGFDKGNWPDMASPAFAAEIDRHYGKTRYWEHTVTDAADYTGAEHLPNRSSEYEPTVGYKPAPKK